MNQTHTEHHKDAADLDAPQEKIDTISDQPVKSNKNLKSFIATVLTMFVIALGIIINVNVNKDGKVAEIRTKAAVDSVTLSVQPSTVTLPPDSSVNIMLNAGTHGISFAMFRITFDRTQMQLTQEITTSSLFQSVVSKSTMAEANASGSIVVALGLFDPIKYPSPPATPSGVIELAQLRFHATNTSPNLSSTITFNETSTQIAEEGNQSTLLNVTHLPATVNINPQATVTPPQVTLQPSHTPIPTVTTAPTSMPTAMPTNTPTVLAQPTSTPRPTVTPVLTIAPTITRIPTQIPTLRPTATPRPLPSSMIPSPTPTNIPQPTAIPTPILTDLTGDINNDGCVDRNDVNLFIKLVRNNTKDLTYDLNSDGKVNFGDMFIIMQHDGDGCSDPNRKHPWWWRFIRPFDRNSKNDR